LASPLRAYSPIPAKDQIVTKHRRKSALFDTVPAINSSSKANVSGPATRWCH
jgi:hypothetical protein